VGIDGSGPIPVLKGTVAYLTCREFGHECLDPTVPAPAISIMLFDQIASGALTSAAMLAAMGAQDSIDPVAVNILQSKGSYTAGQLIPRPGQTGCDVVNRGPSVAPWAEDRRFYCPSAR